MAAIMLVLKCLTNLHAGSGEVNYNIIDNEVERDPVTNYPTIHASGVKGALRVFLKGDNHVEQWFGSEKGKKQAGLLKILNANMLAVPMRTSEGDKPYQLVYTDEMKKQYEELREELRIKNLFESEEDINVSKKAEGHKLNKMSKFRINEEVYEFYRMEEEDFEACALPVIARNKLEEGISKNLWYEEVVPHKSMFYVPILANDGDRELLEKFKEAVDGQVIQFGGNASIGYGLCKVFVAGEEKEHE